MLGCGATALMVVTVPMVPQVLPLNDGMKGAAAAGTLLLWLLLTTRAAPGRRWGRTGGGRAWRALGLGGALALALGSVLALRVFGFRTAVGANPVHLNTIMYSVAQVLGGQHLLVDLVPQYGLYAEFLKPWFLLVGFSTSHFVQTCAGLQLLSLAALILTLRRFLRGNALLWLGTAMLAWFMMMNWSDVVFNQLDPYFQYFPFRMVCPAVSVALAGAYLRRPTSVLAVTGAVWGGLGVWWNVDSGAVTLAAWFVLLGARAFSGRPQPGRSFAQRWGPVGLAFTAAALAMTAFYGVLCWEAGRRVDLTGMLRFQGIFYGSGFFMMPMPLEPHPWMLVAGVYLLGLTHGLADLRTRAIGPRRGMVLYLSVLGTGLFSYYQGRSHDFNLVHTCWPALLAALLLGDRLLLAARLGQVPRLPAAAVLPLLALGVACALVIGQSWPIIADLHRRRQQADAYGGAPDQADAVVYLQRTVAPGEACAILSPFQALLHAESGRRPSLSGPSLFECLLKADLENLLRQLRERRLGQVFFEDEPGLLDFRELLDPAFSNTLTHYYRFAGSNPAGNLLRWEPRSDAEVVPDDGNPALAGAFAGADRLPATPPTTLQAIGLPERRLPGPRRFHNIVFPSNLGTVELGDDFAVEIRCATGTPQTLNGTLLSNHPGRQEREGFTIQQVGTLGNEFACAFGDGTAFTFCTPFLLAPGREHYLVVSKAGTVASVFLDGQWHQRLPLPKPMANSSLLMTIGDWVGGTRPFRGSIEQVKIHFHALPDEQVEANWRALTPGADPAQSRPTEASPP